MVLPTGSEPNRVLLVEGRDDKYVVDHIRRRHDPMPPFEIVDKGGLEELLASIGPELKAPGRRALGIVVDANDDIEARWAAVTDRLGRAGIEVGDRDPGGTVIRGTSSDPDVGVWIMPDNRSPGELEDFIAAMIPRDDSVWPLSRAYVDIDGIPAESRLFSSRRNYGPRFMPGSRRESGPARWGWPSEPGIWRGGDGLRGVGGVASSGFWRASRTVNDSLSVSFWESRIP